MDAKLSTWPRASLTDPASPLLVHFTACNTTFGESQKRCWKRQSRVWPQLNSTGRYIFKRFLNVAWDGPKPHSGVVTMVWRKLKQL